MKREAERAYGFLESGERFWSVWSMNSMQSHLLTLLHRNDRMGMSGSIEARFPYLDEHVVHFGLNLPRKHKIRWAGRFLDWRHPFLEDKAVVRAAAGRMLPRSISERRKLGFPAFGLQHIVMEPEAFAGGWIQKTLQLRESEIRDMVRHEDRYMVGKLLAVDVFGRLFGLGETIDDVSARLARHCTVETC